MIISSIASPQATGVPFSVTITATNANGTTDTSFNGTVGLSSSAGAVSPSSVALKNGVATAQVKITSPGVCTYLTASGMGKSGRSNSFTVSGSGLDTGYVMGFVKGSLGLPVSGATVYLSNDCHGDSRTTNSNGYFEFRNIPCSEYNIRAEKDAASSQTDLLKVTDTACNFKELIISSASSGGKIPILLLPGIMGSSTGKGGPYPTLPKDAPTAWNSAEWGGRKTKGLHDPLGQAGWQDLIKDLQAQPYDYKLDEDLFCVPYDWRMDWKDAAEKYLKPAIEHALAKTGQGSDGKVNIIAHSMGGLLVRAYIQGSEQRKNQINKLAMVGTPNHGSANPYYMWFGGDPKSADEETEAAYLEPLNFYSNTTELAYEAMHDGKRLFPLKRLCTSQNCWEYTDWNNSEAKKNAKEFYQKKVRTVGGLLRLSPFLYNGSSLFEIPDNHDLALLNAGYDLDELGDSEKVKIFAGDGQKTINIIDVGKPTAMYRYGAPKSARKNYDGDGTVPLSSAEIGSIEVDHSKNSSHAALVKNYRDKIIPFITGVAAGSVQPALTTKDALGDTATAQLSVSVKGAVTPCVTVPGGGKAGIDPATDQLVNTASGATLDMDSVAAGIIIASPADGVYTVQVKGSHERDYRVEISYLGTDGSSAMVSAIGFNHADTQAFTFSLDAGAENKLLLGMDPAPPEDLTAFPYDFEGLKTELKWTGSDDPAIVDYRVYSREETEPFMHPAGSVQAGMSAITFSTNDPWAENSTVPTRFYAVAAVKADGSEGFLSEWAKNNDRDHDGLSDEEETAFGSDMTKADTDGDGLKDGEEYLHGTSPVLLDTDGDGYSDHKEVQAGSDPLDKESLPVGSLTVTITPQAAIDAGAKWQVDGGEWRGSGQTLNAVEAGEHTVAFLGINGWTTAKSQNINIEVGKIASVTGLYTVSSLRKMLWSYKVSGLAALWTLDSADNRTSYKVYGPYAGWDAKSYGYNSDGTRRMLWARKADGTAALWTLDADDNRASYKLYGPYKDWTATSYHENADGSRRLLWSHSSGLAALWTLDAGDNRSSYKTYGPYAGWEATSYHQNADGSRRMLWTRKSDGMAALWTLDANDNRTGYRLYGPYKDWVATSYHENADGSRRMLWSHSSGLAALWTLDAGDNRSSYKYYGPHAGWSAESYD